MKRVFYIIIAAALALTLLSGCSGGATPPGPTQHAPTAAPTEMPTAAPTTAPQPFTAPPLPTQTPEPDETAVPQPFTAPPAPTQTPVPTEVAVPADMAGNYRMVRYISEDAEYNKDELDSMSSLGYEATLCLNEDGSGELTVFGESSEIIWTQDSVITNGYSIPLKYENGQITLNNIDTIMVFAPGSDSPAPVSPPVSDDGSIVGSYRAVKLLEGGQEYDEEKIAAMEAIGLKLRLHIFSDGTAVLDMYGEKSEFEWDEDWFEAEGDVMPYYYDNGILTLGDKQEFQISFRRMTEDELKSDYEFSGHDAPTPRPVTDGELAGSYKLWEMDMGGETMTHEMVELMELTGYSVTLALNADGTGELVFFEQKTDVRWDAECLYYAGSALPLSFADGLLTAGTPGGTYMSFEPVE